MAAKRGNPNIKDIGHDTRFCGKSAVEAAKKKHEKEKIYRPLKEIVAECLDEESVRQIMAALMQKAMEGDVRAWETLRDSSGQKPKEEVQMDNTVRLYFDDPDAEDFSG